MKWVKIFNDINQAQELVPNQTCKLLKIGERKICLINHQGRFYAVDDRCPHMGESLSGGIVNYLGEVICPLHEYRFSTQHGEECERKCDGVEVYQMKQDNESLWIAL